MVRTINKIIDGRLQAREFMTTTNSEVQPVNNRNIGSNNPPAVPDADYDIISIQRGKIRVWTSTKLPGTDRLTLAVVTP